MIVARSLFTAGIDTDATAMLLSCNSFHVCVSAGVGRTGCFVALSIVLERMRCEGVLDIFQTVKMLRIQRPAMVQTLDQYQFVYDTALEYLDSFDHYADYAPLDVQEDEQEVD